MRKWITLLMTLLVGSSVSYANANTGQVTIEAGYRHDNLSWRTRFPSDSPFLKTSTRFEDLDIFQIGLHGRSTLGCNFYARASAYWGWILDGDFKQNVNAYFSPSYSEDFDIGFGNRHTNIIEDKWVYGANIAVGYPFYFCNCTMVIAPVIGYSIDEQNIKIDDEGFDLYADSGIVFPVSGSSCCEHKWISRWFGPFVGFDFSYSPHCECWNLWAELEYHFGDFQGKRHVNGEFSLLGLDHRKFHSRDATGWVVSAGADYDLCNCWTVGVAFKFQDWDATRHHRNDDSFSDYYFSRSGFSGRERNNFKWHSYEVKLAVGKEF